MAKRNTSKRPLAMKFWKQAGESYYAEKAGLVDAIAKSHRTEDEARKRMGAGYDYIQLLLDGKGVTYYSAMLVDWGLSPDSELSDVSPIAF